MSNENASPSDKKILFRKWIKLRPSTIEMLKEKAIAEDRKEGQMAAWIIEQHFKRGEERRSTNE